MGHEALEALIQVKRRGLSRGQQNQAKKLSKASRYELVGCFINEGWQDQMLANVSLVRRGPDGTYAISSLMTDLGCQGVRAAYVFTGQSETQLTHVIEQMYPEGRQTLDPSVGWGLVQSAMRFAAGFEYAPDAMYVVAAALWRGVPEHENPQVRCGDGDGRPIYFYDETMETPEDRARHEAQLTAHCGANGYRVEVV